MRCNYCEWRCELGDGSFGVCGMYREEGGVIRERYPHRWCSYTVSLMESIPFYHAYPGGKALCVGTFGCNFRCSYCSNGFLALKNPELYQERMFHLTPERLVKTARQFGCDAIVFNVNEPTVSLPTLLELHQAASRAGLAMGCLTNGYGTPESTRLLASICSFIGFSLKGFSDAVYRSYMGVPGVTPVMRNLCRLVGLCHLEVITPVIQGVNASLEVARSRLDHVYFHNFVGSDWANTTCPSCGGLMIERFSLGCGGDRLRSQHSLDGRCRECGGRIPLLTRREDDFTGRYLHGSGDRGCASMAEPAGFAYW